MTYDTEGFAARLTALRESRGLTQEALAERTGLSAHYIGNLEQRVRTPSLNTLFILCRALGATPDDLLRDSITEDMQSGRCSPAPDDYALRDVFAELSIALEGWLEPDSYDLASESPAFELTEESPFRSLSEMTDDEPAPH